jgi:hypothetical protein
LVFKIGGGGITFSSIGKSKSLKELLNAEKKNRQQKLNWSSINRATL